MEQKNGKIIQSKSFIRHHFWKENGAGFTLIEMLVAVTIFITVVTIASGIFVSSIKAQRSVLAVRTILDETSYAMEYMSRSLRMAKKDLSGTCLTAYGYNYENPAGDTSRIRFIKFDYGVSQDVCHEFFLQDEKLYEYKKNIISGEELTLHLTSDNLQINSLKFSLEGESQDDDLQPRATIFLDIKGKEQSKIKIQTTISQRNLDVKK